MKTFSLVTTLLALGIAVPAHAAYALDLDALIEAAKNGNGTYVETHSSASTGGHNASSGETVQTGDVSASSYTEINANNEGGQVTVIVETSENGETKTSEYTEDIPKGGGVKVEAKAESVDGASHAEVKVNDEVVDVHTETHSVTTSLVVDFFTETIPDLFKKVVGFLF